MQIVMLVLFIFEALVKQYRQILVKTMTTVTLAEFIAFIREQRFVIPVDGVVTAITIDSTDLPDNSTDIQTAYDLALATVSLPMPEFYKTAFLNLAFHMLICYSSAAIFDNIKALYKVDQLRTGVIGSASDSGTSASWQAIPSFLTNLNAYENWLVTTPYGRAYFNIASRFVSLAPWGA